MDFDILNIPIKDLEKKLKTEPEDFWVKRGEKMALGLFKKMSKRVPAYKDFLEKNKINSDKIKTIKDFKGVPFIDKDNYLRKYPLEKLCWDGKFKTEQWDISSTSGTTGNPFYFPRTDLQNKYYAKTAELYLRNNFEIHKRSTLYINTFALGVWIGGIFTYEAIKTVCRDGVYPITLINPGLNKSETIKVVNNLGDKFEQIIIAGYPPFVKDIIDEGVSDGLDWGKYNIKFIFSAEGFSEKFREYLFEKAKQDNIYFDSLNHYGTVDQGTLAHETPLTILTRRELIKTKNTIFDESFYRLPTLA